MSKCLNCKKYEDCSTGSGLTWPCGAYAPKVISTADHIRSMTDEELADFLVELADDGNLLIREWLKRSYKEE